MADYTNRDEYDAAMQDWLREQAQNREQSNEIERVRAKAQFDAETFEKRYTLEQTNQIAKYNTYMQWVDTNEDFSPEDKKRAKEKIELLKLGIQPTDLPRLSRFPKGRGPGDYFEEGGIGWKIDKDGQRMEVDERGSIRGEAFRAKTALDTHTLTTEAAREAASAKRRDDYEENYRKATAGFMEEEIEVEPVMKKDAKGTLVETPVFRKRNFGEASRMAREIYPLLSPQQDLRNKAGQVSPGGKYVWDGWDWVPKAQWVPNQKR